MAGPFLHLIQYHAELEHEDAFDRWYNIHILNVLQIPGYEWSSRYVSLGGDVQGPDTRNLTLYIVKERAAFDVVFSPDNVLQVSEHERTVVPRDVVHEPNRGVPSLREDKERYEQLEGVRYIHSSVYEQVAGSHLGKPLFRGSRPLLLLMTDVAPGQEEAWNRWANREELPALVQDPWVVMVGRFRAIEEVIPPWLVQGPRHLTLCELAGEEAAKAMFHPELMSPGLRQLITSADHDRAMAMTNRRLRYFYKPVSQHHSFRKMAI